MMLCKPSHFVSSVIRRSAQHGAPSRPVCRLVSSLEWVMQKRFFKVQSNSCNNGVLLQSGVISRVPDRRRQNSSKTPFFASQKKGSTQPVSSKTRPSGLPLLLPPLPFQSTLFRLLTCLESDLDLFSRAFFSQPTFFFIIQTRS